MAYSDKVIEHYENPRNVGTLRQGRRQRRHGPRRRAGVRRRDEAADQGQSRRRASSRTPSSRPSAAARRSPSSSLATEWVKGKTVDEALAIKNTEIVEELSLPPVKIHCSVLAEDAIKAAIADYKKKQDELEGGVIGRRRRPDIAASAEASSTVRLIQITDTAARKIQSLMAKQGITRRRAARRREGRRLLGAQLHLRVGARAAAGRRGLRGRRRQVFVDQKSYLYLKGTELDYDTELLSMGFVFNNPNAKQSCGCGSSFGV